MWNYKKEEKKIEWLESTEDVSKWLGELFLSKKYTERMKALRLINQQSMKVDVEKN